jgi:hypothetical protein
MQIVLPVMMEASTCNLNPLDYKKNLLPESNEVDDVIKTSETPTLVPVFKMK